MESRIALVKNWFSKAENDLRNSELIFAAVADDKPFDTVCFHCQQAAEKYLKGLLTFLDIPFPKTHNIEVLMDLVSQSNPSINSYAKAVALTYYAVENRYPDDFVEISEEEALEAYKLALEIKSFVLNEIQALCPDGGWSDSK